MSITDNRNASSILASSTRRNENGFPLEINKDRGRKMSDIQRIFDWIATGLHWIGSVLGILAIIIVIILVWLSDLLFGE